MLRPRAVDVPKTYTVHEITVDVITKTDSTFVSLLTPTATSILNLKSRIASARNKGVDEESYRIYYCGIYLQDEDSIPKEVFDVDDFDSLFEPRCTLID